MKESVALAKDVDAKKDFSSTRSDNSIHRLRNEPEKQLGSLWSVIGNIRHDGGTPSLDSIATELSSMHTAQRAPVILALQRTHGNRYVQRVVAGIQAKLKVRQPGDIYEQEADRVAEQVMRMPEPRVQRQAEEAEEEEEEEEKKKEEELIQLKENSSTAAEVTPGIENSINSLRGGGQPLPESVRNYFEPRFGYDFSGVRIHTGEKASDTARALNSRAFTIGSDVVFNTENYSPDTEGGKKLLAHELTHVVQQRNNKIQNQILSNPENTIQCQWRGRRLEQLMKDDRRATYGPNTELTIGESISKYSKLLGVPSNYVKGIIHYERKERGFWEELVERVEIFWKVPTVSLGPGDVQVLRAAEILYPYRDLQKKPLTDSEFEGIVKKLKNTEEHVEILVKTLNDNYNYYGKVPGKTKGDRWRFAIAKHKGGHGVVGPAQEKANKNGENGNKWADVSKYMDSEIVNFVNNVVNYYP
jgi:hypothetical protein